jgi:hypothetical protein
MDTSLSYDYCGWTKNEGFMVDFQFPKFKQIILSKQSLER